MTGNIKQYVSLSFFLSMVYFRPGLFQLRARTMSNEHREDPMEEALRRDPRVERLLKNPNWEGAANAAIAYLTRGEPCPIASWRKSSTWAQVEMVHGQLRRKL